MIAEEKSNVATRLDTAEMISESVGIKNLSILRGMGGERIFLATLEPPPENCGHKQPKGEPPRTERSPQFFAERPKCWSTSCKTKQLNMKIQAALEGGCKINRNIHHLVDRPQ